MLYDRNCRVKMPASAAMLLQSSSGCTEYSSLHGSGRQSLAPDAMDVQLMILSLV